MTADRSEPVAEMPARLNYAPTRKPSRWRIVRRAVYLIALTGLAVLAVHHGPDFLRRVTFLYHQRGWGAGQFLRAFS